MGEITIPIGNLIMGSPTDKSVMASVVLEKGSQAFIEFGEKEENLNRKTSAQVVDGNDPLVIEIDDLQANMLYHYRLAYKLPGTKILFVPPVPGFQHRKSWHCFFIWCTGRFTSGTTGKNVQPGIVQTNTG